MKKKCAVFDCENYKNSYIGITNGYFTFPKDEKLKMKWIKFCRREDDFSPGSYDVVCMDHFTNDDVLNNKQFEMGLATRLRLHHDAYPTIPTKSRTSKKREERQKKLEYKEIVDQLLKEHEESNSKRNYFVQDPLDAKEIVFLKLPKRGRKELEENPLEGCEKYEENSLNELNDASENDLAMEDEIEIFDNDDTNLEGELEKLNIDIDLEAELERLHNDQNVENELEKLRNENCEEPIDERLQREMYLESEVERLQKEVESLRSENLRLQTAETKYLKTLAAVKKKYMMTLETAHRKYLESEEQYLCEINTLKERLENIDYENNSVESWLYEVLDQ